VWDESNTRRNVGDVAAAVRGREVLLVTHGFSVPQLEGMQELSDWARLLDLGNAAVVGMLWPGDARWIPKLDYPVEGDEAMKSGDLFAAFVDANFAGALSVSFASHSLGARVVLETLARLKRKTKRLLVMAGAIDNTCLSQEYMAAAASVETISVLSSRGDDVLKWAFPTGNFLSGIISRGVPYVHEALGREGPAEPFPDPNNIHADWQIPDDWEFGHGNYLPAAPVPAPFGALPHFPLPDEPEPPAYAPRVLADEDNFWKPAWSAALQSWRWK
jgi:hypothetical protein